MSPLPRGSERDVVGVLAAPFRVSARRHARERVELAHKMRLVVEAAVRRDLGPFDADALLPAALRMADKRVVVKRPDYAGWLNEHKPSMAIETKSNRFDVYVMAALAS